MYAIIEAGVRQEWIFWPNLINLYSESILRELEVLPGIIFRGHNFNNIRYTDGYKLMEDKERKHRT